ncbi:MAG TPA: hypothetical protein VKG23_00415 [Thermoanaerobaculia bacterium]|nr:hypothetical protein [Thermoanaerobaculia bacterium]
MSERIWDPLNGGAALAGVGFAWLVCAGNAAAMSVAETTLAKIANRFIETSLEPIV